MPDTPRDLPDEGAPADDHPDQVDILPNEPDDLEPEGVDDPPDRDPSQEEMDTAAEDPGDTPVIDEDLEHKR
jgi:hypothetical protein